MSLVSLDDRLTGALLLAWDAGGELGRQGPCSAAAEADIERLTTLSTELMVMEAELLDLLTRMESGCELSADDEALADLLEGEVRRIAGAMRSAMSRIRDRQGWSR